MLSDFSASGAMTYLRWKLADEDKTRGVVSRGAIAYIPISCNVTLFSIIDAVIRPQSPATYSYTGRTNADKSVLPHSKLVPERKQVYKLADEHILCNVAILY